VTFLPHGLARVLAPAASLVAAAKVRQAVTGHGAVGPGAPTASREVLTARVDHLQSRYDGLRSRGYGATSPRLKMVSLALADAKDDVFRHDVAAECTRQPARTHWVPRLLTRGAAAPTGSRG